MQHFDIFVIGAGPGGYVAAIRASQLGFSVASVDSYKNKQEYKLGGTCLNVGCIPSKALLESSANFYNIQNKFSEHGITCEDVKIDIDKMIDSKNNIINKHATGISYLFKKYNIKELHGICSFVKQESGNWIISVDGDVKTEYSAKHVIIATGSLPRELPSIKIDNINILDNAGALDLTSVPKHLCIIGAGVIGVEMASVWQRLGSKVTVLEASEKFLPSLDEQVSKELFKNISHNIGIFIGISIHQITNDTEIKINYSDSNNIQQELVVDKLLIAVGRIPNTAGLNTVAIGLEFENGFIKVDENCRTNLPNIWAIGDVVRGPMLAHKASQEGTHVVERIAGQKPYLDNNTIPWVIYTHPEVAFVGKTEEQLIAANIKYKKGVAYFMANARAHCMNDAAGFVKILASETDKILGVHIIGPMASELIAEAVLAMEFSASSQDIAMTIHAHPSLSETLREAAMNINLY